MSKTNKENINVIPCIKCDADIQLPRYFIETQKFTGDIKCKNCDTLLHIKKVGGQIQEYKILKIGIVTYDEAIRLLYRITKKEPKSDSETT